MLRQTVISDNRFPPGILTYTDIRSYIFTAIFIMLSVTTPWVFHQFHMAGATFLPMHIFVLLGGLLFGWRAGLIIGLFAPLVSFSLSAMPAITILPQIVIELSFYGFAAGIMRQKRHMRIFWSLTGAMIAGRLALLLAVSIIGIFGAVHSPLGLETSPLSTVWAATKQSWPGIITQLACIPLVVILLEKVINKADAEQHLK